MPTTVKQTLTGPQFASITDFTDLWLEFKANKVDLRRSGRYRFRRYALVRAARLYVGQHRRERHSPAARQRPS